MVTYEMEYKTKDENVKLKAKGFLCWVFIKFEHKQELESELIFKDNNFLKGKMINRKYRVKK